MEQQTRRIAVVDALPHLETGKVDREKVLREVGGRLNPIRPRDQPRDSKARRSTVGISTRRNVR